MEPNKTSRRTEEEMLNFDIPNSGMTADEYEARMQSDMWARSNSTYSITTDLDELLNSWFFSGEEWADDSEDGYF